MPHCPRPRTSNLLLTLRCCPHRSTDFSFTQFRSNSYLDLQPSVIGGLPYTNHITTAQLRLGHIIFTAFTSGRSPLFPQNFQNRSRSNHTTCGGPLLLAQQLRGESQHTERVPSPKTSFLNRSESLRSGSAPPNCPRPNTNPV